MGVNFRCIIDCKIHNVFLVLHYVMTEGRLMKSGALPLHTVSLASRHAQYLQVPTKALEAANVSSSELSIRLQNSQIA